MKKENRREQSMNDSSTGELVPPASTIAVPADNQDSPEVVKKTEAERSKPATNPEPKTPTKNRYKSPKAKELAKSVTDLESHNPSTAAEQGTRSNVGRTAAKKRRTMPKTSRKRTSHKSSNAKTGLDAAHQTPSQSVSSVMSDETPENLTAAPDPQVDIINKLTIAYADWEESAKRHASELDTVATAVAFVNALGDSVTFGGANTDVFDRGKGYLSWLQGMALWRIRPLPGATDKPMELRNPDGTRMAWSEFLKTLKHPMSESTAYWCRRIYATYDANAAKITGYLEMIAEVAPSYHRALKRDRAKWEKQHEFDKLTKPAPPPPGKDASIPVKTVERTLDNVAGTLERLKTVAAAPDLFSDIEESLRILSDQQKRVDGLRRALNEAEKVLQETYEQVVKYRDDGGRTGQRKAAQVRASRNKKKGK